ncbi:SEN34 subunit of tRNA-splicing endonuclease [Polyplosphaeria fusca]|uniref:tRNA-splicing endonuclease subunit Sen34 n=1 Tax=Polyplosphaeria fusca TaxID=682080 RepID=A0A9P4R4I5_9PLEO|nr:SEN34 subunit of tRNA-splicing endonuclease [Polyplosphaeria fusca]
MALPTEPGSVQEPFPISRVTDRYLIFDVNAIMHARSSHNITGVLTGTIPNLSQQNAFLGIPLQLMPEEARVLVEKGAAYIVDDVNIHDEGFMHMDREARLKFLQEMDEAAWQKSREAQRKAEERTKKALEQKGLEKKSETPESAGLTSDTGAANLFDSPCTPAPPLSRPEKKVDPHFITPTTSYPPLAQPPQTAQPLPVVPRQYPLFRYLHSKGYFMMPGLRFGCHYSAYPGDPLRFHSHFLATGMDWDEEFDWQQIIAGGRLGTRVKKAYLIGGEDPAKKGVEGKESVRVFSIEWAGM